MKSISTMLTILLTLPISMWLQYQVLARVNATDLMWFLYWMNLPFIVLAMLLSRAAEAMEKGK